MARSVREPFPLYGGRVGLGVFTPARTTETLMGAGAQPLHSPQYSGHTPTQPSPIAGEGFWCARP